MNIIETNGLSHRYWKTEFSPGLSWRTAEVVSGLTFAVPEGSVFALLGPNGAGKTTTIKMLMNLLQPTRGEARVLGVDSRRLGERELAQLGYVSENQQLPLWMTVRQLLAYCRPFYPTWDLELERTLLAQFDLPVERKLAQLSRGMKMKAALLSVLAYRPRLLVLDEPFGGLDPVVREDFTTGLLEAAEQGDWTMIISSHDIEEVERLADRIALLDAGRLKFTEATESLLGRFRRVELGLTEAPAAAGDDLPASWLGWQQEAGRATFIESAFQPDLTERACRERFPAATVQAHPMTLREIFITLARPARPSTQGVAP